MGQVNTFLPKCNYKLHDQVQVSTSQRRGEGEKYKEAPQWTLFDGSLGSPPRQVSIFCLEQISSPISRNMYQRYKTLRHPSILQLVESIELEEEQKIYIATESVIPLENCIEQIRASPQLISLGLYQISQAIGFLNHSCHLVHGNINISSIYVTKEGDWKLGGLELLSPTSAVQIGQSLLSQFISYMMIKNLVNPPEINSKQMVDISAPSLSEISDHSIDSWLFATLIYHIFNWSSVDTANLSNPILSRSVKLKDLSKIPYDLHASYTKLFAIRPSDRLPSQSIVNNAYFQNFFVQTYLFVEQLSLKENIEKDQFFNMLLNKSHELPKNYVKYKMITSIVRALDFGSANHLAIPVVLDLSKLLTKEEFQSMVSPSIMKWFASPNRIIRMALLERIEDIVVHLTKNQVSKTIWTTLNQGFTDSSPLLRELTVKSIIHFAPKLSSTIINGEVLKYLATTQADQVPGIRTNTTICLGKISTFLSEDVRRKVLFQAFSRTIHDPFAPSRKASITCFTYSFQQGHFSIAEVATKIIPMISPLTIDPIDEVRDLALYSITTFLESLQQHSKVMSNPETPAVIEKSSSFIDVVAPSFSSLQRDASTLFDWAIGKITNEISKDPEAPPSQIASQQVSSNLNKVEINSGGNNHSRPLAAVMPTRPESKILDQKLNLCTNLNSVTSSTSVELTRSDLVKKDHLDDQPIHMYSDEYKTGHFTSLPLNSSSVFDPKTTQGKMANVDQPLKISQHQSPYSIMTTNLQPKPGDINPSSRFLEPSQPQPTTSFENDNWDDVFSEWSSFSTTSVSNYSPQNDNFCQSSLSHQIAPSTQKSNTNRRLGNLAENSDRSKSNSEDENMQYLLLRLG